MDGGWVLMLPDPDSPLFYVYAEATGEANGSSAGGLMDEYVELVRELIQDGE